MSTHTQQFLEEICRRHGRPCTGYAIARIMRERYGWSEQTAYNYRKGSTAPDDRKALDIAAELELDPMYVIACIQADRAADAELRSLWETMAERARRTAAAVILSASVALAGLVGMFAPSAAYARQAAVLPTGDLYIMRTLRRLLAWLLGDGDGMDAAGLV